MGVCSGGWESIVEGGYGYCGSGGWWMVKGYYDRPMIHRPPPKAGGALQSGLCDGVEWWGRSVMGHCAEDGYM